MERWRWGSARHGQQQLRQHHPRGLPGQATHKAVDDMGAQLDASATKVPTIKQEVSGLVADVSGNTLILNVGKKAGIKVGDILDVSRPGRVVKDPSTGKVIKSITDKVGSA